MYLPRYVRSYQADWQKHDRFLRVRRSLDNPNMYVVERKTRYTHDYPFSYGTDRQIQLQDGYRPIYRIYPSEFAYVLPALKATDVQGRGGAKALADQLDAQDDVQRARESRQRTDEFTMRSSDAYDRLAWLEGRRVSFSGAS